MKSNIIVLNTRCIRPIFIYKLFSVCSYLYGSFLFECKSSNNKIWKIAFIFLNILTFRSFSIFYKNLLECEKETKRREADKEQKEEKKSFAVKSQNTEKRKRRKEKSIQNSRWEGEKKKKKKWIVVSCQSE